jgi:DNA-directed RNA polymerase subunit L
MLLSEYESFINNKKIYLDVKNDNNHKLVVTSGDIKIVDKNDNSVFEDTDKVFKKCVITDQHIDIVYLEPKYELIGKYEQIKLESDFKIGYAYENGAYNVASTCVFTNTIDDITAQQALKQRISEIENDKNINDERERQTLIEIERNDFINLDRKRYFIPNSFDFKINSTGVYENKDLVKISCFIMMNKLNNFKNNISNGSIEIKKNYGFTENCYELKIEHEDYTLANVLKFKYFTNHFNPESDTEGISFVGVKKDHPHEDYIIVRVAYKTEISDIQVIQDQFIRVATECIEIFNTINNNF